MAAVQRAAGGGRDIGRTGFAAWHDDHYAVEVMRRLSLPDGAFRVEIVHYTTADEVDRLLEELRTL